MAAASSAPPGADALNSRQAVDTSDVIGRKPSSSAGVMHRVRSPLSALRSTLPSRSPVSAHSVCSSVAAAGEWSARRVENLRERHGQDAPPSPADNAAVVEAVLAAAAAMGEAALPASTASPVAQGPESGYLPPLSTSPTHGASVQAPQPSVSQFVSQTVEQSSTPTYTYPPQAPIEAAPSAADFESAKSTPPPPPAHPPGCTAHGTRHPFDSICDQLVRCPPQPRPFYTRVCVSGSHCTCATHCR